MLDPLTQAERLPDLARRLERVERLPVGLVADRVDADREARLGATHDDLPQLVTARDHDAGAVEHPRRLRAERPVHERLQVADAQPGRAEAAADPELAQRVDALVRLRLPDAELERAGRP